MARRRPTLAKLLKKKNKSSPARIKASRFRAESLEPRRMMVVLHGGDVFEFFAEDIRLERVVVTGNTTVELFGTNSLITTGLNPGQPVLLDTMRGVITSGPDAGQVGGGLPPEAFPASAGGTGGAGGGSDPTEASDNIYQIYVTQGDVNSSIAIAAVSALNASSRPMQPFTGAETIRVRNVNSGTDEDVSEPNTGLVYIGAKLFPATGSGSTTTTSPNFPLNRPVFSAANVPAGAVTTGPGVTRIGPGLTVTPGNNLGQFLLGGTLTGTVNIHGSINLFYAGWLLTGDASGEAAGGNINVTNFSVDGDIHTLLTNGSIGTDTDTLAIADFGRPNFTSGFGMLVGGKVGEIRTLDSFVGNVNVLHTPGVESLDGTPYIGVDVRGPAGFDPFDSGNFGGDPLVDDTLASGAQFLGPIDANGTVEVNGEVQASSPENKALDYYAVPLLAGQTVTAHVTSSDLGTTSGFLSIGVFDAEQRLIASDNSNVDRIQTIGQPFQVTAKTPGVYYFCGYALWQYHLQRVDSGRRRFQLHPDDLQRRRYRPFRNRSGGQYPRPRRVYAVELHVLHVLRGQRVSLGQG